jgi:Ca2+-transporting ATPase
MALLYGVFFFWLMYGFAMCGSFLLESYGEENKMNAFISTRQELLKHLGVEPLSGLTTAQAQKSRETHGPNVLTREKPESLLKRIWKAATEPMIIMLIMAGLIALVVNIIRGATGGEVDYLECLGVFAAIFLSVIITVVMEGKSAKAFEALSKISDNLQIKAIRDGNTVMLSQREIVVGDILLLATGDKIPADGRLLESAGLAADESALTGESIPAKKDAALEIQDPKTPLAERGNMLYCGNFITSGHCKMVVTAVGDATEFGKIARELTQAKDSATPLQE